MDVYACMKRDAPNTKRRLSAITMYPCVILHVAVQHVSPSPAFCHARRVPRYLFTPPENHSVSTPLPVPWVYPHNYYTKQHRQKSSNSGVPHIVLARTTWSLRQQHSASSLLGFQHLSTVCAVCVALGDVRYVFGWTEGSDFPTLQGKSREPG